MQTFLPAPIFKDCAKHLDDKRVNKQRVECLQIYNACVGIRHKADGTEVGPAKGWKNHPAVRMWKGYEAMLCVYSAYMCAECDTRGFADNNNLRSFFNNRMLRHEFRIPPWWYDADIRNKIVHSHRCNLVRKDFEYYAPQFPDVQPSQIYTTNYFWPR